MTLWTVPMPFVKALHDLRGYGEVFGVGCEPMPRIDINLKLVATPVAAAVHLAQRCGRCAFQVLASTPIVRIDNLQHCPCAVIGHRGRVASDGPRFPLDAFALWVGQVKGSKLGVHGLGSGGP